MLCIQDVQTRSTTECTKHMSTKKNAEARDVCGGQSSAAGSSTGKPTKKTPRMYWTDDTAVHVPGDPHSLGRLQCKKTLRRTLPLKLSRRAAHVCHVLNERSSVTPLLHHDVGFCQPDNRAAMQNCGGTGDTPAQQGRRAAAMRECGNDPRPLSGQPRWMIASPRPSVASVHECPVEWTGACTSHGTATQPGQMLDEAFSHPTGSKQSLDTPLSCSMLKSGPQDEMHGVNADKAPLISVDCNAKEQLAMEAGTAVGEQAGACKSKHNVPKFKAKTITCPSQPLYSSTAAAVNAAHAQALAINGMRQQIVTGSVPGVSIQT